MKRVLTFLTRRLTGKAAFACVFLFALTGLTQAPLKIATINLEKVFESYYKTKQADAVLESSGGDAQKVFGGLLEDLKKANDEYKKLIEGANDQAVSSEERDRRKKQAEGKLVEMRDLENTVLKYKKQATESLLEQKRRLRDKILVELKEVVEAKARANSYTHVLDTSAKSLADSFVVLYSNGQNDLTEEVISHINATAPAGFFDPPKQTEEKPPVVLPKVDETGAAPVVPKNDQKSPPAKPGRR